MDCGGDGEPLALAARSLEVQIVRDSPWRPGPRVAPPQKFTQTTPLHGHQCAPQLVDAERRRQLLIDAAWRSLATRDFRDLRVDDVCDEAGMSKGAFFDYFDH